MSQLNTQAAGAASQELRPKSLLEAAAQLDKDVGKLVPKLDTEQQSAIGRFIAELLSGEKFVDKNLTRAIKQRIAAIDEAMAAQINEILHHPDFQKLEGTWRGMHYMVKGVEAGPMIKMQVLDITKDELADMFEEFDESMWDQSPLYKLVYERGYGMPGGQPVGCIVGDFELSHGAQDIRVLRGMGKLASAAHAPFIASTHPSLFKMESWTQINDKQNVAAGFDRAEYAGWNSFRESEDAKYVGLTMPRFLSRLPYGEKKQKVKGFAFEEDTASQSHDKYTWSNAAFAMGRRILESFDKYGWCSQICGVTSGGRVGDLPVDLHEGPDGQMHAKVPTEVAIPYKLDRLLSLGDDKNGGLGLMPLSFHDKTDYAVFFGAQSLHKPKTFVNSDYATSNSRLGAKLPNIFACSRFAHYLKRMVYDKVGGFATTQSLQTYLYEWIQSYVEPNPDAVSEEQKAMRPLAEASVEVEPVPGAPGQYFARFKLKPHYKLETLDVAMSLVSQVKQAG
jgi:type VI secretion system protein ImpC